MVEGLIVDGVQIKNKFISFNKPSEACAHHYNFKALYGSIHAASLLRTRYWASPLYFN